MSIVNISSENLKYGNEAEYTVKLEKPLMRAIGVQILNATVPLTYNIFNKNDNSFVIADIINKDGASIDPIVARIPWGTYSGEELAQLTTVALQKADTAISDTTTLLEDEQRKAHINTGQVNKIRIYNASVTDYQNISNTIWSGDVKPGFVIYNPNDALAGVGTDGIVRIAVKGIGQGTLSSNLQTEYYKINRLAIDTGIGKISNKKTIPDTIDPSVADTVGDVKAHVLNRGFIMAYDNIQNVFILSHPTHTSWKIASGNTRRVLKTYGFTGGQEQVTATTGAENLDGTPWELTNAYNWAKSTVSSQSPELAGPSLIFLRLGGDMLLDQQNTETNFPDRIPIPLDKPHGSVVHFESDDKTDVIPFSVPCDVSYIKCRFEYGDDNGILGGELQNLRGHHTYLRLKFYFAHESL